MKKLIFKSITFVAVFYVTLMIVGNLMNKGHNNMTMSIDQASLPVLTMQMDGMGYNTLHGYTCAMDPVFQRDNVTLLDAGRAFEFVVEHLDRTVKGMRIEVRSTDGKRLVENTDINDYVQGVEKLSAKITLKDLIDKDTKYSLAIFLKFEDETEAAYYTQALWSDSLHLAEEIAFVKDFHERLYDKEAAQEIKKYLETKSSLDDNSSFHKVGIHSSFQQVTWGELEVKEEWAPAYSIKDITSNTAAIALQYLVSTKGNDKKIYYMVEEYYRVRYSADRMYLLDYDRTMTQLPNPQQMYANNKILFGIADENIQMMESTDGNIVAFEVANALFTYNMTNNKFTTVFSFCDLPDYQERTLYNQNAIKILDITENGNVMFAVYGYMNRGRHEGEVGISLYCYDQGLNTIEELEYISYNKPFGVLKTQMEQLLYFNREQELYLGLDGIIYKINVDNKDVEQLVTLSRDDEIMVSDSHKIMVWQEGTDAYHGKKLHILNMEEGSIHQVIPYEGESVKVLGFMGEDVVYGIARNEDIYREQSGQMFFPMYQICIRNPQGEIMKEYEQPDIYVMDCVISDNQITLTRKVKNDSGRFHDTIDDHIMNNQVAVVGKNVMATATIDVYEKYVQLQVKNNIDSKTIKLLNPKEVVFEGERELDLIRETDHETYYAYGPYGVCGIYFSAGNAVEKAYEASGMVTNESGECIWRKGNRVTKNQIMAIKEHSVGEGETSLSVCLDTILQFNGYMNNAVAQLQKGADAISVLKDTLQEATILDLTGCSLDAILYYVNQDIPVLALLENGEAVLVTGFNEFNVVIMEPAKGTLYKKGMNDSTEWFAENGNCFITYCK